MKFISAKKVRDYGLELYKIRQERLELQQRINGLKAQEKALILFLDTRSRGESYQFADDEGYLMQADFQWRTRTDIDSDAVRRFYAKLGKKVPMQKSDWCEARVSYVKE